MQNIQMYLQQTLIHQFMINAFDRDAFENSGEKNKRGSVDLVIFTVGVERLNSNCTLVAIPQFLDFIIKTKTTTTQQIFVTFSSDFQ